MVHPLALAAPFLMQPALAAPPPPDVQIAADGTCTISDTALKGLQARAFKLLRQAGDKSYGSFPGDRKRLAQKTVETMFTRSNICSVLTTPPGVTAINHNAERNKFKADTLEPADAKKRGMVTARLPLIPKCLSGYDWKHSPEYTKADACGDVTGKFGNKGVPTAMYAARLQARDALNFLNLPSSAPRYSRYANSGPIACGSGPGYRDAYHRLDVCGICPDLEYVLRGFEGKDWTAWTLRNACTTPAGKTYSPTDLMFDNGVRVFVPVDVEVNGQREARTVIASQVAAASNSALAFLVTQDHSFHRFIGGEYAKRLLLEAKAEGWTIK